MPPLARGYTDLAAVANGYLLEHVIASGMCRLLAYTLTMGLGLVACGGSPFQAGADTAPETGAPPTAATPDASPDDSAAGSKSTGTAPDALIAAADAGQSEASSTGDGSPSDAGPARSSDAAADSADHPSDCPDVGCLCVVASPPDCPAGWPYVPRGGGMCCNWPAP